jgi:allantoin racemase
MNAQQRRILVFNPFGTDKYDEVIAKMIEPVKLPDTAYMVSHMSRGPDYCDYWSYMQMLAPDVTERVYQAEKEGYDGVFVACGYEPGVRAAREIVDIPVVGALIPSVLIAHQLGTRFSIFYNSRMSATNSWDLIRDYGLEAKCASIQSVDLSLREILAAPHLVDQRVAAQSRIAAEKGAEVIILACTVEAAYFTGKVPGELAKLVYLNCNVCAFKYLEMMVELQKKVGLTVSRMGYYASPGHANRNDFETFRAIYGYK